MPTLEEILAQRRAQQGLQAETLAAIPGAGSVADAVQQFRGSPTGAGSALGAQGLPAYIEPGYVAPGAGENRAAISDWFARMGFTSDPGVQFHEAVPPDPNFQPGAVSTTAHPQAPALDPDAMRALAPQGQATGAGGAIGSGNPFLDHFLAQMQGGGEQAPGGEDAIPQQDPFAAARAAAERGRPVEPVQSTQRDQLLAALLGATVGSLQGDGLAQSFASAAAGGLGGLGQVGSEDLRRQEEFARQNQAFALRESALETQMATQRMEQVRHREEIEARRSIAEQNINMQMAIASRYDIKVSGNSLILTNPWTGESTGQTIDEQLQIWEGMKSQAVLNESLGDRMGTFKLNMGAGTYEFQNPVLAMQMQSMAPVLLQGGTPEYEANVRRRAVQNLIDGESQLFAGMSEKQRQEAASGTLISSAIENRKAIEDAIMKQRERIIFQDGNVELAEGGLDSIQERLNAARARQGY